MRKEWKSFSERKLFGPGRRSGRLSVSLRFMGIGLCLSLLAGCPAAPEMILAEEQSKKSTAAPPPPALPPATDVAAEFLSSKLARQALEAAPKAGLSLNPSTGTAPPKLTGTYLVESGQGTLVAASDGSEIGKRLMRGQWTMTSAGLNQYAVDEKWTSASSFSLNTGSCFVYGDGNTFTEYRNMVTDNGGGACSYRREIVMGTIDPTTGDLLGVYAICLYDNKTGNRNQCDFSIIAGVNGYDGTWNIYHLGRVKRIGS